MYYKIKHKNSIRSHNGLAKWSKQIYMFNGENKKCKYKINML